MKVFVLLMDVAFSEQQRVLGVFSCKGNAEHAMKAHAKSYFIHKGLDQFTIEEYELDESP